MRKQLRIVTRVKNRYFWEELHWPLENMVIEGLEKSVRFDREAMGMCVCVCVLVVE